LRDITRLYSRVARTVRENQLIPRGAGVLVACSGGPDSLCLLDALVGLRVGLGIDRIVAVYVDHGLRPSAAAEVDTVGRLAAGHGLELVKADVASQLKRLRQDGRSPEDAARVARYAALEEQRVALGLERIAVGHTRSDQAETVLLGLARSGRPAGMPARRGAIVRPLLDVTAVEVLAYLQARQLVPCYDESNGDPSAPRNHVRLEVLPALRLLNPRIEDALAKAAVPPVRLAPHAGLAEPTRGKA
jgi:tRNA(Ile)-lysidine synthase